MLDEWITFDATMPPIFRFVATRWEICWMACSIVLHECV
jgi:hypothetical protein